MTVGLIDRAAAALATSPWDTLDAVERDMMKDRVRRVLQALRDPDDRMAEAGAEIIRHVRPAETDDAYLGDAANTWRFMIDALLGER